MSETALRSLRFSQGFGTPKVGAGLFSGTRKATSIVDALLTLILGGILELGA